MLDENGVAQTLTIGCPRVTRKATVQTAESSHNITKRDVEIMAMYRVAYSGSYPGSAFRYNCRTGYRTLVLAVRFEDAAARTYPTMEGVSHPAIES